jgi:hypothetical protein
VDTSAPFVDEQRVFARRLILTLLAVGGLVVAAGFVYLRSEEAAGRLTANAELEAIARLKSAQIESWRNERRSDARFLLRTPAVTRDVADLVARPDDPAARARLLGWLEPIKGEDRYESILVFDTRARLLLALPAGQRCGRRPAPGAVSVDRWPARRWSSPICRPVPPLRRSTSICWCRSGQHSTPESSRPLPALLSR